MQSLRIGTAGMRKLMVTGLIRPAAPNISSNALNASVVSRVYG